MESVNSILNIEKVSKRNFQYSIKRNRKTYSEKAAQQRAQYLSDKFKNPQGLNFYLKCAWNLTDQYLDWLTEYSFKKANPGRYFVSVAAQKMRENA